VAGSSARAAIIVNGGFETGAGTDLPINNPNIATVGWYNPSDVVIGGTDYGLNNVYIDGTPHSGSHAASLVTTVNAASIWQQISLVAGESTDVDFWAKTAGTGYLSVALEDTDGSTGVWVTPSTAPSGTAGLMVITGATAYTEYNYSVIVPFSSAYIQFQWNGLGNTMYLDDVSVTQTVPEPAMLGGVLLLLLPLAGRSLRRRAA
jgi:hypothetical protein